MTLASKLFYKGHQSTPNLRIYVQYIQSHSREGPIACANICFSAIDRRTTVLNASARVDEEE
jgi:hypothetical protein